MTSALARKFAFDAAPYVPGVLPAAATGYVRFKGINDFDPQINAKNQDVDDYDSDGWTAVEKTMQSAVITIKARRPFDGGVYDPGQEIVRAAQIKFGDSARVFGRYYDRAGGPEARAGVFLVDWSQGKSGVADVEEITAKLTNDGKVYDIANPYTPTAKPVIAAVTPSGKGAGQVVQILGQGFTGTVTNGVKFGGTNATDFIVVSDSVINAVLPAGSAGNTNVTVTNATGASDPFVYVRA